MGIHNDKRIIIQYDRQIVKTGRKTTKIKKYGKESLTSLKSKV